MKKKIDRKTNTKSQYKIRCAGDCEKCYHKGFSGVTHAEFKAYGLRETEEIWRVKNTLSSEVKNKYVAPLMNFKHIFHLSDPTMHVY